MYYSVSEAVSEVIDEMHFLSLPLREDLINYSALARFIKPIVDEKIGGEAGLEAITMALRKKALDFSAMEMPEVFEALRNAQVFLITGMSLARISRNEDNQKKLMEFQQKTPWDSGEQFSIIQQNEEISIIAPAKRLEDISAAIGGQNILSSSKDLAVATLIFPEKYLECIGCIELIGKQFSDLNVSIAEIFSSHAKISVAFNEAHAAKVYEKLSKVIKASASAAEMKLTNKT